MEERKKLHPRPQTEKKELTTRLHKIQGQLSGIETMLENDRWCGDILLQTAAAKSALDALSRRILEIHLKTCVSEQIRAGHEEAMDEAIELIKKHK